MEEKEILKCPNCSFSQELEAWKEVTIYEHDGKISEIQESELEKVGISTRGDHCRCPKCENLLHIEYDLI